MGPLLVMLRAAGDPTRLRLLLLLAKAELTVSEITDIIGQSQPRISRHLKLLCDAGLLERIKEGAWVFYRGSERGEAGDNGHAEIEGERDPAEPNPRREQGSDNARPDAAGDRENERERAEQRDEARASRRDR